MTLNNVLFASTWTLNTEAIGSKKERKFVTEMEGNKIKFYVNNNSLFYRGHICCPSKNM